MLKLHIKRDNINANINTVILRKCVKATLPCKTRMNFYPALQETYIVYKFLVIPLQGRSVHIKNITKDKKNC